MSHDFKITNKVCDHILRGIPCFVSDIDGLTLLPRGNPSIYTLGVPVPSGVTELKLYNQSTRECILVPQNDPVNGWTIDTFPIIAGFPLLGTHLMVRFKQRQKNLQGIWKLSYQVTAKTCTKCNGANTLTDIDLVGDPDRAYYVQNEAKLAQDFLKYLLTPLGSDPYYPWMGTSLMDLPGSKMNLRDLEKSLIEQIRAAGDAIKNLQVQQSKITEQQISPREMLNSVTQVTVEQDPNDSRQLLISINLMTNSRTMSSIQLPFSNG